LKTKFDDATNEAKERGRECVRFDLYAGDFLLALMPRQSVGVWKSSDAEKHVASCARCSHRLEELKAALQHLRGVERLSWTEKPAWLPASFEHEQTRSSLKHKVLEPVTVWIGRYSFRLVLSGFAIALAVWAPSWIRSTSWDGLGTRLQSWWDQSLPQSLIARRSDEASTPLPIEESESSVSSVVSLEKTVQPQPPPASTSVAAGAPAKSANISSPQVAGASTVISKVAPAPQNEVSASGEAAAWTQNSFFQWGAFTTQDLEQANSQVLAILAEHGATQAGELVLGASHRGGKYYHFSVPANAFDALQNQMLQLGMVEFTRTRAVSARRTPTDVRRVVFLLRTR
jgi:hypothetical protein